MDARGRRYGRGRIWRRRLLAIAALVVVGIVAWRLIDTALGPDTAGATVEHLTIKSHAVGRKLPVTVVSPPGDEDGERRPLLVFLHGRGSSQDSALSGEFFAALAKAGSGAPIVALPYGGDHSYWHNRASGGWASYVMDEVIPEVAHQYGADEERVAVGGISMGGFGAFDLVLHYPGRFCAVGGHGPALWQMAEQTAAGAFDDVEDFDRNDVVGAAASNPAPFVSQRVWVDAGTDDPFQPWDRVFADELRNDGADATIKLDRPGGHDSDYWNAHWGEYMRFYAHALAGCHRSS
jgi:S-formylglutathione hydrolase FrmB